MGLKYVDLDNEAEKNEYRKHKKHEKFLKENRVERTEVVTEPVQPEKKEEVETQPAALQGLNDLCGKVIKIDQLRVRNYPEGDVIKLIPRDTELKILSDVDDCWYKVKLKDGTVGFCMKTYLRTYIEGEMYGLNDNRRCKTCPTTRP